MAVAERAAAPPESLSALADRFRREDLDPVQDGARARLVVRGGAAWDAVVEGQILELAPARDELRPDAELSADAATWQRMATDVRAGMTAFHTGQLEVRRNLHLGAGLLAATSGDDDPGRLRFGSVRTPVGRLAYAAAGTGHPVVCLPGLGGTKGSFLPTLAGLAGDEFRVIAVDLPGFGDSDKPIGAAYDAPFFARAVTGLLDSLEIDRAHLIGNSMGGRVALEVGMTAPDRSGRLVLLAPAMAWLRDRRFAPLLKLLRPELGLLQIAPRGVVEGVVRRMIPGADGGWAAAGVDEWLRAYLTPRGRAAFYAAARNIYLDEPHGETGFWSRLVSLSPDSLFIWGKHDTLVPISFMRHVEDALPAARHLELACGHVPQIERPDQTNRAIRSFLLRR